MAQACLKEKCPLYDLNGTCGLTSENGQRLVRRVPQANPAEVCSRNWRPRQTFQHVGDPTVADQTDLSPIQRIQELRKTHSEKETARIIGCHPDTVRKYGKRPS